MTWPVEIDGREFHPIPQSWIDAGDELGEAGKRLFAVSVAISSADTWVYIRYAHPVSGQVLLTKGEASENPNGDGIVPGGLARGTGWPRCLTPSPHAEPVEPLRSTEWDHLRELWSDHLDVLEDSQGSLLVTDGGQSTPGTERGYHQIDCECGRTTTAEDREHATVLHLTHVLNDHEDLEDWERETAREQLETAKKEVGT